LLESSSLFLVDGSASVLDIIELQRHAGGCPHAQAVGHRSGGFNTGVLRRHLYKRLASGGLPVLDSTLGSHVRHGH
jgi:hypothetical protein